MIVYLVHKVEYWENCSTLEAIYESKADAQAHVVARGGDEYDYDIQEWEVMPSRNGSEPHQIAEADVVDVVTGKVSHIVVTVPGKVEGGLQDG